MTDIAIRTANDDELDAVAEMIVDAYAEYAAVMSPDAWSTFAQDIANVHGRRTHGEILVAEVDERIVGTVTIYRGWRGAQEGAVSVRLLAVHPNARGFGVGRAILEWVAEEGRREGRKRVVLTTMPVMDSMRELTDSMGFERAPELDHEPAPGARAEGYSLTL